MHIKNIKLLALSLLLLSSTTVFSDKPVWAGNAGKPSNYEKREHKEDMTSKHEYKKQKKNKKQKKKIAVMIEITTEITIKTVHKMPKVSISLT